MPLIKIDNWTHVDVSAIDGISMCGEEKIDMEARIPLLTERKIMYRLDLHLSGGGIIRTGENSNLDEVESLRNELLALLNSNKEIPHE